MTRQARIALRIAQRTYRRRPRQPDYFAIATSAASAGFSTKRMVVEAVLASHRAFTKKLRTEKARQKADAAMFVVMDSFHWRKPTS